MGMRERGAALATNLTYISNMVIADLVIRYKAKTTFQDMVFWYDKTVLYDVCNYLKIGIPGMLMLCFEWWAFEILALFTGLLGVDQLATEVVIINLISFIFMLPLGISYSASALTGNYIGEGKIDLAKYFAKITVIFDILCTLVIIIVLWIFKD
jgi:Na+-driven multidrug efflux pump